MENCNNNGKVKQVHSKTNETLSKYNFYISDLLKTLQHKIVGFWNLILLFKSLKTIIGNSLQMNNFFHRYKFYILNILYNLLNKSKAETLWPKVLVIFIKTNFKWKLQILRSGRCCKRPFYFKTWEKEQAGRQYWSFSDAKIIIDGWRFR